MKILYGVPGEGMGHATRTKVTVSHLLKKHDVHMVSSSRAFHFLDKLFLGRVTEIEGFHFAYKDARVSKSKTFAELLKTGPKNLVSNLQKYSGLKKSFFPDLIISDFESFTFYFAKYHKIPIICLDNQHILTNTKLEFPVPREEHNNYNLASNIVKLKNPKCDHYIITTFFYPPVTQKNTTLVPGILRDEILHAKTKKHHPILVYQTSQSQKNLVGILQEVQEQEFLVYGYNKEEQHGNVKLKAFSEKEFIENLAACKAVITNGGFSLISEAVYLRKPVCTVPIKNQFEQYINSAYIQKLGYGRHFPDITSDNIKAFLHDLERFSANLESYHQDGNSILFNELDRLCGSLA